jgi:hypothetical protein
MNKVFQQSELGPHAQNPEEYQEPTVLEGSDGTRVIPNNGTLLLMFSFSSLQHCDDQTPAQEPGEKGQQRFSKLGTFFIEQKSNLNFIFQPV